LVVLVNCLFQFKVILSKFSACLATRTTAPQKGKTKTKNLKNNLQRNYNIHQNTLDGGFLLPRKPVDLAVWELVRPQSLLTITEDLCLQMA
jgi:hypothetical protein